MGQVLFHHASVLIMVSEMLDGAEEPRGSLLEYP